MNSIIYRRYTERDVEKVRFFLDGKRSRFYLIGIGGVSMSAIARMLAERGHTVAGSDTDSSENTEMLKSLGVSVYVGHSAENVREFAPDACVYSLSIDGSNDEYRYALENGIATVSRAAMIFALSCRYGMTLGVAGSHGKSTVSAMLYSALSGAGVRASMLFGADYQGRGAYVRGGEDMLVLEACEYGNSFLELRCDVCVLLNLELDHTDFFPDIEALEKSFLTFASRASRLVVLCADDERLMRLAARLSVPYVTFGKSEAADLRYESTLEDGKRKNKFYYKGRELCELSLGVIGEHNVRNAAAVLATCTSLGIINEKLLSALSTFTGIGRRIEPLGRVGSTQVFYDYAHHPTEITATLDALTSEGYRNIDVIFRPHTYSRTESLLHDFARSLARAHRSYILDIFAAREAFTSAVSAQILVNEIRKLDACAEYLSLESLDESVKLNDSDALVIMGAGDVREILLWIKEKMKKNR